LKVGISLPVREMAGDLGAIKEFAQAAEDLGLTHLRVPDQVIRPNSGHLHEPLSLLCYLAGVTQHIELVPSVIVMPLRQTALLARQTAALDVLSNGRLRLGIGVGASEPEYQAMGIDFHTRGARCDEQLELIHQLWREPLVTFEGRFDTVIENGIDPRPLQSPIPIWIGARAVPSDAVVRRMGKWASGWFVLVSPEEFGAIKSREGEWQERVQNWFATGLTHLCLRTLGGGLTVAEHLPKMRQAVEALPIPREQSR
jgi:probable F420-dependent oxidoreductase